MKPSRRAILCSLAAAPPAAYATAEDAKAIAPWEGFPRQDYSWVREVVVESHRDLAKVKALVDAHPALANATIDWGFGDWDTALGAAAHTGRRSIAEYLIEMGARLDIFAAAMLGMTATVKAMIAAQPGIERTLGPHGIPLLSHAKAGGEQAKDTLAFLSELPGAAGVTAPPLDDARRKTFAGKYRLEGGPGVEIQFTSPSQLSIQVERAIARPLRHAGNEEFYPAGARAVRVRFDSVEGSVRGLTITDGPNVVKASRIS